MPGRMDITFNWGRTPDGEPEAEGAPFSILVVAPWRGAAPPPGRLDERPAIPVDVESFDDVFARIAPGVVIEGYGEGGAAHALATRSVDDLHPDALLREVPALRSLASLLTTAKDPATFQGTAPSVRSPATPPAAEADAATLARLLGRAPTGAAPPPAAAAESAVDRLIREAVAPHIVAGPDPRQAEVVTALEAAIGAALRVVLRQPALQALQARWLSLRRLVFGIESEGPVRVYLLDVAPDEWTADLAAGGDEAPPSIRRAIERAAAKHGGDGWSLFLLDATFEASVEDVAALRGWGALAASLDAPVLANAGPSLAGAASVADLDDPARWKAPGGAFGEAWSALRRGSLAPGLGLALPRVLARAPYGALTDPIDTIPFEETGDDPAETGFVWSGAAWSCAVLIAAAAAAGHEAPLSIAGTLEDLPFAIYTAGGGRKIRGATETALPDRAAEGLLDAGLIPAVADASRNELRIPRLQSIADPLRGLGQG
jgi:predicted component of type VI protein secretion system